MKLFEAYAGKKWTYSITARRYVYILETLSNFQLDPPSYSYETIWRNEKAIIAYHGQYKDSESRISLCVVWNLCRDI